MSLKSYFNIWLLLALLLGMLVWHQTVTAKDYLDTAEIAELLAGENASNINQTLHSVDYRQLQCVATAVYYESANEPRLGQIAVARVIQNRVRSGFADSPCDVVYQRTAGLCQFSWACEKNHAIRLAECADCWSVAVQVLAQDRYQNYMRSALYFHATSISPGWTNLTPIRTIGNHKFYRRG
jgi:spore germination cell wall hydrolase CwlJ-like protein